MSAQKMNLEPKRLPPRTEDLLFKDLYDAALTAMEALREVQLVVPPQQTPIIVDMAIHKLKDPLTMMEKYYVVG